MKVEIGCHNCLHYQHRVSKVRRNIFTYSDSDGCPEKGHRADGIVIINTKNKVVEYCDSWKLDKKLTGYDLRKQEA